MSGTEVQEEIMRRQGIDQRAEELEKEFSYDGYQVVRRELFAHLREPAVVIRRDSITFNTACIAGLEDVIYIQVLVNPDEKKMVVRKCEENDKDALRWCIAKPDKRKSRKITSKVFSEKIYTLMDWDKNNRYKILGHKITYEDETIYIFELYEPEIYLDVRSRKKRTEGEKIIAAGGAVPQGSNTEIEGSNGEKNQTRKPYYPEAWKDSFGLPVAEHGKSLEIDIKNGFTEFEISGSGGRSMPSHTEKKV